MSRPNTPFPNHWHYHIAIKSAVIGAAVVLVLKLLGGL
jgi:hypothetical protein